MITLDYKEILIAVLLILVIIFVIYLIVALKRLMPILKNLEKVSEDATELTKDAKECMIGIKKIAADAGEGAEKLNKTVKHVCKLADGHKNTISAVTSVTNAAAGLVNLFKK